MKTIQCRVFLLTAIYVVLAFATQGFAQPTEEQPATLAEAVASLNKKADEDFSKISKANRPVVLPAHLTVEEVVKAIHEHKWNKESTRQIFIKIAETKVLPPKARLTASTNWYYDNREHDQLKWWIDLNVRTGENTGYNLRVRDEVLDSTPALLPSAGYDWLVDPHYLKSPFSDGNNAGGVLFYIDTNEKKSLSITASWVPAWAAQRKDEPVKWLRFVAFDAKGKRYKPELLSVHRHNDMIMAHFTLDSGTLPADQVKYLGIEALTADSKMLEKISAEAVRRAKEKRIEVLPWPRVGQPYDFALTTTKGEVLDSAKLRGKVVLIDCWASWCGPCMITMPRLKKIYDDWHAKGLEIIGLSFDDDLESALAVFKSKKIPWPMVLVPNNNEIQDLWEEAARIDSMPRILLVDRQGMLHAYLASSAEIENSLEKKIVELFQDTSNATDDKPQKSPVSK